MGPRSLLDTELGGQPNSWTTPPGGFGALVLELWGCSWGAQLLDLLRAGTKIIPKRLQIWVRTPGLLAAPKSTTPKGTANRGEKGGGKKAGSWLPGEGKELLGGGGSSSSQSRSLAALPLEEAAP